VAGLAGVRGPGIQRALARRRSIAAHGLGLGMKGSRRWVISICACIAAVVVAQTVKAVAVVRGRFAQVRRSQVLVMRSGMVFAEVVGLVESALALGDMELPLLHSKKNHHCPRLIDCCDLEIGFDVVG
jgi:hypothetical protein